MILWFYALSTSQKPSFLLCLLKCLSRPFWFLHRSFVSTRAQVGWPLSTSHRGSLRTSQTLSNPLYEHFNFEPVSDSLLAEPVLNPKVRIYHFRPLTYVVSIHFRFSQSNQKSDFQAPTWIHSQQLDPETLTHIGAKFQARLQPWWTAMGLTSSPYNSL